MAKICSWDDQIVCSDPRIIEDGARNSAFQQAEFLDSMLRVRRGIESAIGAYSGALQSGDEPQEWYLIEQCYNWYSPEIWCWGNLQTGILERSKLAEKFNHVKGVNVLSCRTYVKPAAKTILAADWDRLDKIAVERKWEPLIWSNNTSRCHEGLIPERMIQWFGYSAHCPPCCYSSESFDVEEMSRLGLEVQFQAQLQCEPLRRLLFEVGTSDDDYMEYSEE